MAVRQVCAVTGGFTKLTASSFYGRGFFGIFTGNRGKSKGEKSYVSESIDKSEFCGAGKRN